MVQVVPLYSALFSSLSHPSVLRAIFIDAQAFEQADFITNLVRCTSAFVDEMSGLICRVFAGRLLYTPT